MAEEDEELISTLTWSESVYSLAQFVENFHLPQIVRVEVGQYGENDTTNVEIDQVITLHALRTTPKLASEDSFGRPIAIPLDCPVRVLVYPLPVECGHEKISTDKIELVYPRIKHVRVIVACPREENHEDACAKVGSVLEITKNDVEKHVVHFENVCTGEEFAFPNCGCSALFEPLLDGVEYTLQEVKRRFGLPAIVRFSEGKTSVGENPEGSKSVKKTSEDGNPAGSRKVRFCEGAKSMRKMSVGENAGSRKSTRLVTDLGKVTLLSGVITDRTVVASEVGSGVVAAGRSLKLYKHQDLVVRVAEGLVRGEERYAEIVEIFDQRYLGVRLTDSSERLDVYEHLDEVRNHVERLELLDQRLEPLRKNVPVEELEAPELPKRNVPVDLTPPPRPPKSSQIDSKRKTLAPQIHRDHVWIQGKAGIHETSFTSGGELENDEALKTYVEPMEMPGDHSYSYAGVDNNIQEDDYEIMDNLIGDYNYDIVEYKPNLPSRHVPRPTRSTPTDVSPTTVSLIPKDLSGLSVNGVGKLLKDLHMEDYVSTFKKELIDGAMLASLDRESLESLNVSSFYIKKLMKVMSGWRPDL